MIETFQAAAAGALEAGISTVAHNPWRGLVEPTSSGTAHFRPNSPVHVDWT